MHNKIIWIMRRVGREEKKAFELIKGLAEKGILVAQFQLGKRD